MCNGIVCECDSGRGAALFTNDDMDDDDDDDLFAVMSKSKTTKSVSELFTSLFP